MILSRQLWPPHRRRCDGTSGWLKSAVFVVGDCCVTAMAFGAIGAAGSVAFESAIIVFSFSVLGEKYPRRF